MTIRTINFSHLVALIIILVLAIAGEISWWLFVALSLMMCEITWVRERKPKTEINVL